MSYWKQELEELENEWSHLAHCSTTEDRNTAYRAADDANQPVIWVETKKKYGDVSSDFIQVDGYRGLRETVVDEEIEPLVSRWMGRTLRLSKPHHRSKITGFIGRVTPGMEGLHNRHIPEFADELAEILFDSENWAEHPHQERGSQ